jgi:hypothetical protein
MRRPSDDIILDAQQKSSAHGTFAGLIDLWPQSCSANFFEFPLKKSFSSNF